MRHTTHSGHEYAWETSFEGVVRNLERRYKETESDHTRTEIERYMAARPCTSCKGRRLRPEALAVKVSGLGIMELCGQTISNSSQWIRAIGGEGTTIKGKAPPELNARDKTIARQILKEIDSRLQFLVDIGLDYLTLGRTAQTLSGGEAQRIRLATQIGSGLTGVLYVCDEPTIGLHPADDSRLVDTLRRLQELGNTVVVVEHDEAVMRAADYLLDLGPGAGEHGGWVVAAGTLGRGAGVQRVHNSRLPQRAEENQRAGDAAARQREASIDTGSQGKQPQGS